MRDIEELRELREYDAGVPPLDDATRARVRARLSAAMNTTNVTNTTNATNAMSQESGTAPAVRRRPVLRIAVTGLVAAAVAGGVVVAGQGGSGGGRTAAPATQAPLMRNVSSQVVLDGAAAYARQHEQTAHPRDDQFIYTKEIIKETNDKTGKTKSYTDESWSSVDDSKPSWVMEVGKGWWSQPEKNGETRWPPRDWRTLTQLPTDPEKLILSLVGAGDISGLSDVEWSVVHIELVGLLKEDPVLPEGLRPAAFEALGMVPGVKAVPNQQDAEGRTGVGIVYDDPLHPEGYRDDESFIFAPDTYEFLGFRSSGERRDGGTITQLSYLDAWAIVDRAKQRP